DGISVHVQVASTLCMRNPGSLRAARGGEAERARLRARELQLDRNVDDPHHELIVTALDRAPHGDVPHHNDDVTHASFPSATAPAGPRDRLGPFPTALRLPPAAGSPMESLSTPRSPPPRRARRVGCRGASLRSTGRETRSWCLRGGTARAEPHLVEIPD